jgi:hypothetical protein
MRTRDHTHFSSWAATISAVVLAAPMLSTVVAVPAGAATAGGFRTTYALKTARSHATATWLEDGDVLVWRSTTLTHDSRALSLIRRRGSTAFLDSADKVIPEPRRSPVSPPSRIRAPADRPHGTDRRLS